MMRANNVHPPTLMTNHEEFENDGDEKIETFEVSQKVWIVTVENAYLAHNISVL